MIIEVKETTYKGILVEHVEDRGWKCNLGGQVYLFPNFVAAQSAIDEIFADIKPVVTKNKGEKMKIQSSNMTKPKQDRIVEMFTDYVQKDMMVENLVLQLVTAQKEFFQNGDFTKAEHITDLLIKSFTE